MLATGSLQQEKARTPNQPAVQRAAPRTQGQQTAFPLRLSPGPVPRRPRRPCSASRPAHATAAQPQVWGGHRHRRPDAPGLRIAHLPGVVITRYVSIGRNFFIRQSCSIGIKTLGLQEYALRIGDNVSMGANSCIVADRIDIGDDVVIGAMSLVTRDIPRGMTFYNPRQVEMRPGGD
uniref:Putative serine acetyl transferase n=1 Tax=Pseudomonas putida TaxID=303 RepID=Q93FY5_PSEPU|nr:putative serine acetyl transferase [Pseudomonas putida DOT-T1E]